MGGHGWYHIGPSGPGKEAGFYSEWNEQDALLKTSHNLQPKTAKATGKKQRWAEVEEAGCGPGSSCIFVTKHDAKFYFPYPAAGPFSREAVPPQEEHPVPSPLCRPCPWVVSLPCPTSPSMKTVHVSLPGPKEETGENGQQPWLVKPLSMGALCGGGHGGGVLRRGSCWDF